MRPPTALAIRRLGAENAKLREALDLICNVEGVRWQYLPMPLYRAIEKGREALKPRGPA